MKNEYTVTGRQKQKQETRKKILAATRGFLAEGQSYTLEDVAQKAGISRATIYRYYSNVDLLSAEAVLDLQTSSPEMIQDMLKSRTLPEQLLEIQQYYNKLVLDNESAFRKYLSIVINGAQPTGRGGRRVETLRRVLASHPSELSDKETEMFIGVATVLMGGEAMVVAKDVCGLTDAQAQKMLQWGLETLIKGLGSSLT